jgi:hypothetical protein
MKTVAGLYEEGGKYKLITFLAESLSEKDTQQSDKKHLLATYSHTIFKPVVPVKELWEQVLRIGATQHYAIVDGDWRKELEDFAEIMGFEFYNIKYTVKRGYYFNEGFNNKINTFIENLFQLRLKYKKEKNPLEKTIKLLLNSIYGKSILKPIDTEIKSIPKANLERFLIRNYNYIKSIEYESNSGRAHIKLNKAINRHFNLPQFGANVLAWSKHLMNRVMCTAEQNGIKIFYQDTDSMHLYENDIDKLSKIFTSKYGTELIGTALCQFHSDFDSISPNSSKVWSKKLIALGKKSYLDILEDDLGNTGYHIRLKGIPNQCILNYCKDNSITVENLYMKLYEGETIVFDIRNGSQCFQKTRTFEQITREVFKRRVKF